MKTIRVQLPVVAEAEVAQLLDLVTDLDGVVGALVDIDNASLDVIVASDAIALRVREELRAAIYASAAA